MNEKTKAKIRGHFSIKNKSFLTNIYRVITLMFQASDI